MGLALRSCIKNIVDEHLQAGFLAFGQCLTAVGWVGGTLPERYEEDGMIELPMADVAGGGFVVGAALMNRRPIYIIRYQGFNWYNCISVLNYACKSKELWDTPCPIFVRSIGMEGGIGPVAGSSHHSLYYRMPGVHIYSPMTPMEYETCYNNFQKNDEVFYVSEHRGAYNNKEELPCMDYSVPDIVLYPISITRFAALKAAERLYKEGVKVAVYHQMQLKPYLKQNKAIHALERSRFGGIVLDDDYTDGIASIIAHKIMISSSGSQKVYTMGLKNKTAGFAKHLDNLPPTADEICIKIKEIIKNYGH